MSSAARVLENPGAGAAAIEHHYDSGNGFFSLWLDPTMTYSCAAFKGDEDLEQAQVRKLDFHLARAGCRNAKRVLDIGCGWGSTLHRAVSHYNVEKAVGLTLSGNQQDYISKRYQDEVSGNRIETLVESWSDHEPTSQYDAIISVGAIEHFARFELERPEKVDGYRSFFECCHKWLMPGGKLSIQSIVWGRLDRGQSSEFITKVIYPETNPPELDELIEGAKGRFEILEMHSDRESYAKTLTQWYRSLKDNKDTAIDLVGRQKVDDYLNYLGICAIAFHTGNLNLVRIALRRLD